MKKTLRLILAATLSGLALASCTQDLQVDDPVLSSAKGTRIINVTFASATKTILGEDGLTPYFENGDEIRVTDGANDEVASVVVSGDKAWFSTNLSGKIWAVYPKDVPFIIIGDDDDEWMSYNAPKNQSGKFEDANNICAVIKEDETTATFEVISPLLKITPPEGTKQFTITSLNQRSERTGQRSSWSEYISCEPDASDWYYDIIVGDGKTALGTYYVTLFPYTYLEDLSFDTGTAMKGVAPEFSFGENDRTLSQTPVESGKLYTISNEGWHPYVKMEMTIGGVKKTYKWATENVGATKNNPVGLYFAWGDFAGYPAQTNGEDAFPLSFNWATAPLNGGYDAFNSDWFNDLKDEVLPGGTLSLENDAAFLNWGGAWRMPTEEEFVALIRATSTSMDDFSGGVLTIKGTDLQFPSTGYGDHNNLRKTEGGYYWSSTLCPEAETYPGESVDFVFNDNTGNDPQVGTYYALHFAGMPIRPIACEDEHIAAPNPE